MRITRSGVCHSDLHIWDGYFDLGGGKRFYVKERGCIPPFTLGPRAFRRRRSARAESEGRESRPEAPDPSVDRLRQMRGVQGRPGQLLRLGHAHPRRQPRRRLFHARARARPEIPARRRRASTTPLPPRSPARRHRLQREHQAAAARRPKDRVAIIGCGGVGLVGHRRAARARA